MHDAVRAYGKARHDFVVASYRAATADYGPARSLSLEGLADVHALLDQIAADRDDMGTTLACGRWAAKAIASVFPDPWLRPSGHRYGDDCGSPLVGGVWFDNFVGTWRTTDDDWTSEGELVADDEIVLIPAGFLDADKDTFLLARVRIVEATSMKAAALPPNDEAASF